ncbi:MAG: glycosyltransferase family 2 protein [Fimbriimonadales bacterium]
MPDFELSITICSWNTSDELAACLRSIEAVRSEANFEVIVVDNASEDGSPDMVEKEFPWVCLHRMVENLGFGKGHNFAFTKASGKLLMPLNSDTVVKPGAIKQLIEFMNQNVNVGIVGPKLLNPDGSLQYSCRKFPTPAAALFRNTPLGKFFPNTRFVKEYLMTEWKHDEPMDVDWVSGAAFVMRRELYDKIGGFDERFFMYMEDVDLCMRTHSASYRVVYFPVPTITHAIGRSTDRMPQKMIRQFHSSMFLFYKKHYVPRTVFVFRPFAFALAWMFVKLRQFAITTKNKLDAWKSRRRR